MLCRRTSPARRNRVGALQANWRLVSRCIGTAFDCARGVWIRSRVEFIYYAVFGVVWSYFVIGTPIRALIKSFDIYYHEQRTDGAIFGTASHGSLRYRYSVDGHTFYGVGMPPFVGTPPSPGHVEVRYSSVHPERCTLIDPLAFPKQVLTGIAIFGFFFFLIRYGGKRKARSA